MVSLDPAEALAVCFERYVAYRNEYSKAPTRSSLSHFKNLDKSEFMALYGYFFVWLMGYTIQQSGVFEWGQKYVVRRLYLRVAHF